MFEDDDPNGKSEFDFSDELDTESLKYPSTLLAGLQELLADFSGLDAQKAYRRLPITCEARNIIMSNFQEGKHFHENGIRDLRFRLQVRTALRMLESPNFTIDRKEVRACCEALQAKVYGNIILKNIFLGNLSECVSHPGDPPRPFMLIGPQGTGRMTFCRAVAQGLNLPLVVVGTKSTSVNRRKGGIARGPGPLALACSRYGKKFLLVINADGKALFSDDDPLKPVDSASAFGDFKFDAEPDHPTKKQFPDLLHDDFLGFPLDLSQVPKIVFSDDVVYARASAGPAARMAYTDALTDEDKIAIVEKFTLPDLIAASGIKAKIRFMPELIAAVVRLNNTRDGMHEIIFDLNTLLSIAAFQALRTRARLVTLRAGAIQLVSTDKPKPKNFDEPPKAAPARNESPPEADNPLPEVFDPADIPPEFARLTD